MEIIWKKELRKKAFQNRAEQDLELKNHKKLTKIQIKQW